MTITRREIIDVNAKDSLPSPTAQPNESVPIRKSSSPSLPPSHVVTIRKGQTLSGIAKDLGLGRDGVKLLAAAGGFSDPNKIRAGAQIDLRHLDGISVPPAANAFIVADANSQLPGRPSDEEPSPPRRLP